jgi:HAD superfamily hydrolase (TIGR01509 family)
MKAFIFDCDGTLIDSEHAHMESWRQALLKRGWDLTPEEYRQLAGIPISAISAQLHQKIQSDSPEAIVEDKNAAFSKFMKQGLPAIERNVQLVKHLIRLKEELGYRLAVASAAPKEEILCHLAHIGILDAMDAVVSGHEDLTHYEDAEGVNKPKPYIYLHAAKLLNLDPAQCMAFEDSGTGSLAAARAGMFTIAVPNPFTLGHDFSCAHTVVAPDEPLELEWLIELSRTQF